MKKILAVTLSTLMILATATGCLKRVDPNSASDAVIGGNSGDEIDNIINPDKDMEGKLKIAVSGDTVFYTVPLSALGVSAGEVVGIKATDNLQAFGDADDFYISGDCAPLGRLNYAYKIA